MGRLVKLDQRGLEEVATSSEMHALVDAAAEAVADHARGRAVWVEGDTVALPVKVYTGETTENMRHVNRAKARVVLAHAAGLAVQAKHGLLTGGASSAGMRVRGE